MNVKKFLGTIALLVGVTSVLAAPFTPVAEGQEISDAQSGLVWRRCPEGMNFTSGSCGGEASRMNHADALVLASQLARSTGLPWRLPNAKELATIADKRLKNPAIDPVAFPNTPPSWFWSYSLSDGGAGYAWFIDFYDGFVQVNGNRSGSYFVRFVRNAK